MIVKEYVHKLIIQLYLLCLKALNKTPSPTAVAGQAGEKIQVSYENARDGATKVISDASESTRGVLESGKNKVDDLIGRGKVVGENLTETAKSVSGEGAKSAAEEGVKVEEYASREAGHLLGNAQALVGKEEGGKGVKED